MRIDTKIKNKNFIKKASIVCVAIILIISILVPAVTSQNKRTNNIKCDYTLTIYIDGNGSVTKNPNMQQYPSGTTVTLTAIPDSGWSFDHWSGSLTGYQNPKTIKMNSNKVVTAHFKMCQYTLTININGEGTVTKDPDQQTYTYGTSVLLTAIPDSGWSFDHWSGDLSGSENPKTIIMSSNKAVTAYFIMCQYTLTVNIDGSGTVTKNPDQPTYTYGTPVLLTAYPDTGWFFDHWSDDLSGSDNPETIVMDGDKDVTAHFLMCQYTLTVNIDGSGSVTRDPDQPTYTYGNSVELTAIPDTGWSFSYWSDDLSGSDNPETIVMDGDKDVTAHFTMCEYTLTVNIDGSGSVTRDPDQQTYTYGTSVLLTAYPDTGWFFDHWSDDLSGSDNPEIIVMDGDKDVTAHFLMCQYTLTVYIDGSGTVTRDPDQPTYTYGNSVLLTAYPDTGWYFDHWSDDLSGSDNPEIIVMDGDKDVTAHFLMCQYTLTVYIDGSGSVTRDPDQPTYIYGTPVQLTAIPESRGWVFDHWSDDLSGSDNPETIVMDGDKVVTAHFIYYAEYTLTIIIDGECGWVTKTPDYPTYQHGTVVMLTADTIECFYFSHWSGDLSGSNNPEYIVMDSDKTVTAHFLVHYYELNIIIDGNGYVKKVPDETLYHCGSNVTLTAVPDPGWDFSYWSGDLSGSDNPTYIKILWSDKTVTAHFTTGEYKLKVNIEGNGVVLKNPDHNTFPYGEEVELTAVPDPGWKFDHWSGDLSGSDNPETIIIDDDKDVTAHFVIANPPNKPDIEGPIKIKVGEQYEYKFSAIDPYGSNVYFLIDWDDGTFEEWSGPYASGEKATFSHTWTEKGSYTIKAKARNIYNAESEWATLDLKMSKSKIVFSSSLQNLLKDYPQLFRILRQVLSGYII